MPRSFLIIFLTLLTLQRMSAAPSVLRALPSVPVTPFEPSQDAVTKFFNQSLHCDFGVFEATHQEKLGWMSVDLEMVTVDKVRVIRMVEACEYQYRLEQIPFIQQSKQELLFDAKPPYALRRASLEETLQKSRRSTVLQRTGPGEYRAVITEQGDARIKEFSNLQFTALDKLGPRLWATNPTRQRGDCQAFRSFDLRALEPYTDRYCIRSAMTAEQSVEVESEDQKEHFRTQWKFHATGEVESMLIADSTFVLRQPRAEARRMTMAHDLLTESFLMCNRPLGTEAQRLSALEVRLSGTDFRNVPSTLNQQVTLNPTGTEAIIRTGTNGNAAIPATPKEIKLNLAATVPIPADDDRLQKMAATAIGKATTDEAKVKRLLKFVSDFLTDDDRVKSLSVFELLKRPRGDCTAHALLFTCLARAAGIPCREASGYIYLGDKEQKFGGHAWNEVVVDGAWHPVDPTWNQFTLGATHLQLSTGHPTPRDARFFSGKVKIHVP
jgi:transglutaminase-like putative cysteine protease